MAWISYSSLIPPNLFILLAMIGVCLGSGIAPPDAIRLGNIAGGLEVEKVGCAAIPRQVKFQVPRS